MGRFVAVDSPAADAIVAGAAAGIGADIAALRIPRLQGVVLGGGYGRGEGGVSRRPGGSDTLSNDLDFHAITAEGASEADIAAIAAALEPVSRKWSARLGVDADFCRPKTPWRIRHDARRLMIQELVRGYVDVAGARGEDLFKDIQRLPAAELPWTEATRLLMNRGIGLLLALEPRDPEFVARNINKAVLGAGDASLIAAGKYEWKATRRSAILSNTLYSAALEWKFLPRKEPVCDWETARNAWLEAVGEVEAAGRACGGARRTLYQAMRWLARRKTPGNPLTLGLPATVRILRKVEKRVRGRRPADAALLQDWRVFN